MNIYNLYTVTKRTFWVSHAMMFIARCSLFLTALQFVVITGYYVSLRLARNKQQRTLNTIQLRFLGLTDGVSALIESLGCAPCHFVGHSMGGFIGMRLAIRHPEQIKPLILIGTTADPEPKENIGRYRRLNFVARWFGLGLIAKQVMSIMFEPKFLLDPDRARSVEKWRQNLISNDRIGVSRAVNAVISRQGVYDLS